MTGWAILTALAEAKVSPHEEVRIEFNGDDQTPQKVVMVDRRMDEDGNDYVCLVVENT